MRRLAKPIRFLLFGASLLLARDAWAATFTVNSTGDAADTNTGDGVCDSDNVTPGLQCTLRAAIAQANATGGGDIIAFNIPPAGAKTITPGSKLPNVNEAVTIDGTTQPGFTTSPIIEINGASQGPFQALDIFAPSTIRGLVINRLVGGTGILLWPGSGGSVIEGCYIGTDLTGTQDFGNSFNGIIVRSAGNRIGGTTVPQRNVISGNTSPGIALDTGASNTLVQGNFIGTNAAGMAALGNTDDNILVVNGASNNTIGGTAGITVGGPCTGACNVISGSLNSNGVALFGSNVTGNVVVGNYVGTDLTGTQDLGNAGGGAFGGNGIYNQAPGTRIGGPTPQERNVISGNSASGIFLDAAITTGVRIEGNFIGTQVDGVTPLPNARGVLVEEAVSNFIGGTAAGTGNVIAGNAGYGVEIRNGASANHVEGNRIGTDAAGATRVVNGEAGIWINGAPGNFIGGTVPGARNLISGNQFDGVLIEGPAASGNRVEGNFIGTRLDGLDSLHNGRSGVFIRNAPGNFVGGPALEQRNVIAGNLGTGVTITGAAAQSNSVAGNFIGTNVTGIAPLGNGDGVSISGGAHTNTIGGTAGTTPGACTGSCNVLSGNNSNGVGLSDVATTANVVLGNFIGLGANATAVGNTFGGIFLFGPCGNVIGGTTPQARNVISENFGDGIDITHQPSTVCAAGNRVEGNYIGVTPNGEDAASNALNGVRIRDGSSNNVIGGETGTTPGGFCTGACNVISANPVNGVQIDGNTSINNRIQGNFIGTSHRGLRGLAGDLGNGGSGGIFSDAGVMLLAPGNLVGGASANARNVISDNVGQGVHVLRPNNRIEGNYIGTNSAGSAALGNGEDGIIVNGTDMTQVGAPGAGNLISGNPGAGVLIYGATNTRVRGNRIGTNAAGTARVPNGGSGILLDAFVGEQDTGSRIGGEIPGEGNLISGNTLHGIHTSRGQSALFKGNFVGTDVTGTVVNPDGVPGNGDDLGNREHGVFIEVFGTQVGDYGNTSSGCTGPCNLISGNGKAGIFDNTGQTQIYGNFIGTDVTGTLARGNGEDGIMLQAFESKVGIFIPGGRNVVSGNGGNGVTIRSVVTPANYGNEVRSNFIGTASDGSSPLPNAGHGVAIFNSMRNRIGGPSTGFGNRIAHHPGAGVFIGGMFGTADQGNLIRTNEIFSNAGLGIDLFPDGVNANDFGDGDGGPNHRQNFPVLQVAVSGGGTAVQGTLNSEPNTAYELDFYSSPACDPSGYGEGARYLGSRTFQTDDTGNIGFIAPLGATVPPGVFITATASAPFTEPGSILVFDETSEFCACIPVTAGAESDGDGVVDLVENAGPNGGDANSDGILDSQQPNVTSFPDSETGDYVVLTVASGAGLLAGGTGPTLVQVQAIGNPSPNDAPAGILFALGFIEFKVAGVGAGSAATVTLTLPPGTAPSSYYKYGPTPGNPVPHWYDFFFDGTTGAQVSGNVITLRFVDGIRGDADITANGQIQEPGGPGFTGADLVVRKVDSPDPATVGGELGYVIAVRNDGPQNATGVMVTDPLPAGVTFVSAVPSQGTCSGTATVQCAIGTIAVGAQSTVRITVRPSGAGAITNTATATASVTDPIPGNNSGSVTTQVAAGPPASSFHTLTPCRMVDTRDPDGPLGGPALAAGAERTFTVAGQCGIPATAKAVSFNVTITGPTSPGHISLYPGGTALPLVSTMNFSPGQTRANNAIIPMGAGGTLAVTSGQGSGTVHFILDTNGYFE